MRTNGEQMEDKNNTLCEKGIIFEVISQKEDFWKIRQVEKVDKISTF